MRPSFSIRNDPHDSDSEEDIEVEIDQNEADDYDFKATLESIFELTYEPVWITLLLVMGSMSVYGTIYDSTLNSYNMEYVHDLQDLHLLTTILYVIDISINILRRYFDIVHTSPEKIQLPFWIVILDVLSLLPAYKMISAVHSSERWLHVLKLNNCLKVIRVYYIYFEYQQMVGIPKTNGALCMFFFNFFLLMAVSWSLTYIICSEVVCYDPDIVHLEKKFYALYLTVSTITGSGILSTPDITEWIIAFNIIGLINFHALTCVTISNLSIDRFTSLLHKYLFGNKVEVLKKEMVDVKVPVDITDCVGHYLQTIWNVRNGYMSSLASFSDLPRTFQQEIGIDFCWFVFKHSSIFRSASLPFLRELSLLIQSKTMLPGDIVFENRSFKDTLFYIVSGVIQVLSEEDDETPILCFTAGTCFGDCSLFFRYKSRVVMRCETLCNVYVLSRKDFIKTAVTFPKEYKMIRKLLVKRVEKTKRYQKISKWVNVESQNINTDLFTIIWLKNTLHKLMIKDGESSLKHECQNVFLRKEFNPEMFENKYLITDHLDSLAIERRDEIVVDEVFIKTSCPCILQPKSPILQYWNAIVIFISIFAATIIPFYTSTQLEIPLWYIGFVYIVTMFWLMDLYIQVTTAVFTSHKVLDNVEEIFTYKIGTLEFVLDIFAALPMELFTCVFITSTTPQAKALLYNNRVLKIWKARAIFKNLEKDNELLVANLFKFIAIYLYTCYIGTCISYRSFCELRNCESMKKELFSGFWMYLTLNLNNLSADNHVLRDYLSFTYDLISVFGIFVCIFIYGEISAVLSLALHRKMSLICTLKDIVTIIDINNVSSDVKVRLLNYVETQWTAEWANTLLFNKSTIGILPAHLCRSIKESAYGNFFRKMIIFKYCPPEFIIELCQKTRRTVLPAREVVCYKGDVADYMYFIYAGYCEVFGTVSQIKKTLGPESIVSFVESCLGLPISNTIITTTSCVILTLDRQDLNQLFTQYPTIKSDFDAAIEDVRTNYDDLLLKNHTIAERQVQWTSNYKEEMYFKCSLDADTLVQQGNDPKLHLYKSKFYSIARYFLLRYTFLPTSKFMFKWEMVRCLCAWLSVVLYTCIDFATCIDCPAYFITTFLDFMAWADIYVKLHVCYYNEKNILVKHPIKTAKYYLTHSFLLDLAGVFPVHFFFSMNNRLHNKMLLFLQLNRAIQMYRLYLLIKYFERTSIAPLRVHRPLMFLFFTLVACICIAAAFFMNVECDVNNNSIKYGNETYYYTVNAYPGSWIEFVKYSEPHTAFRVYLFSISYATHLFTRSGLWDFFSSSVPDNIMISVFASVSYFLSVYIICKMMALFTTTDTSLLSYQQSMRAVSDFMKTYCVSSSLQSQLVAHFQLKWHRKRGKNIQDLIESVHYPLKQDILFELYGSTLEKVGIFTTECRSFLCKLVIDIKHDVVLHNSLICTVNDITSEIFIIFKGTAKVLAPDGGVLDVLGPGSMFGNLNDVSWSRQTIGVLTTGHVDLLTISSVKFFKTLQHYPALLSQFKNLTAFHTDYLIGRGAATEVDDNYQQFNPNKPHNFFVSQLHITFNPTNKFVVLLKYVNVFLISYVEVIFTLYQMAVQEYYISLVLIQYILDFMYIVILSVYYRTAYTNDNGIMITDLHLIQKYRMRDRSKFQCDIASAIPFDLFAWLFPWHIFLVMHPVLRSNRLLRFRIMLSFFKKLQQKVKINVHVVRCVYILLWSTFLMLALTSSLFIASCVGKNNMMPRVECNYHDFSSYTKLTIFIKYNNYIVAMFLNTYQSSVYPDSSHFLVICCFYMLVTYFLRCIVLAQMYVTVQMNLSHRQKYDVYFKKIQNFLKQESVTTSVYDKTCEYMKLSWKYHKGPAFPRLLTEAPVYLREQILNSAFSNHINDHFIFEKCHVDFNRQLVGYLKNRTYFQGNYIAFKGTVNGCMYFIHDGVVSIIKEDDNYKEIEIANLSAGKSFGIKQGLLRSRPLRYSYKCLTKAVILKLPYRLWEHLLLFFPASAAIISERCSVYQENYAD